MSERRVRLAVLGSTGSIGGGVLDVVSRHADRFEVVSLSAWSRGGLLSRQVAASGATRVAVGPHGASSLDLPAGVEILDGPDALVQLASDPDIDLVVNALVGVSGLRPTMAAVRSGKRIALANKESLVAAGALVMSAAAGTGAEVIPVDSEHSSIFRCLRATPRAEVESLVLTASGGPLRDLPADRVAEAPLADVLAHPNWEMGEKVTVDSASLANKAMEVIEARWLFDVPFDRIEVLVHRESVVHSLVRLVDGSMLAHMSEPDMRIPIQYALFHPDVPAGSFAGCRLEDVGALHFEPVDSGRYPCFNLILGAGREGGTSPVVAAVADEVAVSAFSRGAIGFGDIPAVIERTLDSVPRGAAPDLESVLAADEEARERATCEAELLAARR